MHTLTLPARVERLAEASAFVEGLLAEGGCPKKIALQIGVALEELFVNIARYAYAPGEGRVEIQCELSPAAPGVCITLVDTGAPYDPLNKQDPDITLDAAARELGGLGIFLAKKTMDEIVYRYEHGANRVTLVKGW
ncbi:MAG: ATP-binding protein [Oscillospiraceae bacterium]|jgi:anti-sigma regulatory factor (Ser/Thr protein kinase)|nr:ATP-binding protein [Oscillospiraceae bacterium]